MDFLSKESDLAWKIHWSFGGRSSPKIWIWIRLVNLHRGSKFHQNYSLHFRISFSSKSNTRTIFATITARKEKESITHLKAASKSLLPAWVRVRITVVRSDTLMLPSFDRKWQWIVFLSQVVINFICVSLITKSNLFWCPSSDSRNSRSSDTPSLPDCLPAVLWSHAQHRDW